MGTELGADPGRPPALQARVRAGRANRPRRPERAHAADQESRRRERGRADTRRGGGPPRSPRGAERRDRRRTRRVVDLGRRFRAALRERPGTARRVGRAGGRARPPLPLRRLPGRADRGRAFACGRARPRPRAHAGRRRARPPPHLHGHARAAPDRRRARFRSPVLGSRRREDQGRTPLPGLSEHLRRPRQHRRVRATRGTAWPRARGVGDRRRRGRPPGSLRSLLHRRAARTGNRR